ncbi:MAG: RidA family protein [Rhodospirillales bacterium]
MKRTHHKGDAQQKRAYSPAVVTEGGRIVWIAGHTGAVDDAGRSLSGDFDAQVRQTFRNMEKTLAIAGATLKDIVTMTVFIKDPRLSTRFTELRLDILKDDFPASALITVFGFAQPEMMVEIQGIAVIAEG